MQYFLFGATFIFYFVYTFRYYQKLKESVLFTKGVKLFHLMAIWVLPFIWILLLKGVTKRTPGSHEIKTKNPETPWSDPYSAPTDVV